MEKLIKLLNEYKIYTDHKNSRMSEYIWINVGDDIVMDSYVGTTKDKTLEIISKKFGFIKRLVENDKIDNSKMEYEFVCEGITYPIGKSEKGIIGFDGRKLHTKYESILMLLSIQDNPISDLISVLK